MPKTRDAFALKDFDSARILQRPFFKRYTIFFNEDYAYNKHLNFDKGTTDNKILAALSAQFGDSILDLETKKSILETIQRAARKYTNRIEKHADKIRRWGNNKDELSTEYSRAWGLMADYLLLVDAPLLNLGDALKISQQNLESSLRQRYRDRFTERLKEARQKKDMSRRALAERLGYSTKGFGELELGRNEPNLTTLIRLSQELGVSADWLLGLK